VITNLAFGCKCFTGKVVTLNVSVYQKPTQSINLLNDSLLAIIIHRMVSWWPLHVIVKCRCHLDRNKHQDSLILAKTTGANISFCNCSYPVHSQESI